MAWIICFFIVGPMIGTIGYKLFIGARSLTAGPEPLPEWEQPAGRIHIFEGDRYYNSSPDNPYEHSLLNWADGRLACALSTDLAERPEYQPALIGTIQVLKPEKHKGLVAVILDNDRAVAMGLPRVGLMSGAQMLVDRAIPTPTIRSH